jgi:hypothetical protein
MCFRLFCLLFYGSHSQLDFYSVHKCTHFANEALSIAFVMGNEQAAPGEPQGILNDAQKKICDFFAHVPTIGSRLHRVHAPDGALTPPNQDACCQSSQLRLPLNAMLGIVLHRFTISASYKQKHFQGRTHVKGDSKLSLRLPFALLCTDTEASCGKFEVKVNLTQNERWKAEGPSESEKLVNEQRKLAKEERQAIEEVACMDSFALFGLDCDGDD